MINLCDINQIKPLLARHGFHFSKAKGQNFLTQAWVPQQIVQDAGIDQTCGVLEIGPGIGPLTQQLCQKAGKVVAVEVDTSLRPILSETLGEFNNLTLLFADVLKTNLANLVQTHFSGLKPMACANLPYYITSPIIMMLLENELPIDEIVVMVQKEAGERLCAEVGTRQAGAVSVAVNFYASGEILFDVPRESFMPSPKVDSVVIKLVLNDEDKYQIENKKKFFSLVKCAFAQRRKTALNSISNTMGVSKQKITEIFTELGLEINIRPEKLTMQNLIDITDRL